MRKPRISIGIPALNEELNIARLIRSFLEQKGTNFSLLEIIVISDGSTDNTVKKAKSIHDNRVKVIDAKKRMGKSARLNEIFNMFSGDILLLVDSDILIDDQLILSKVSSEFVPQQAGISAVNYTPISGSSFFVNCLNYSVRIQENIRDKWLQGNNYLAFRGCFLVLSRKFAKTLSLNPSLVCNDGYLYFEAKRQGYRPEYMRDVKIYYKSPETFADHIKQSKRFQNSVEELETYFSSDIKKSYQIPQKLFVISVIQHFVKNPILCLGYIAIYAKTRLYKKSNIDSHWQIAQSTKNIQYR